MARLAVVILLLGLAVPARAADQDTRLKPCLGSVVDGTKSCTASASAFSSQATCSGLFIQNSSTTLSVKVGDGTPAVTLAPLQSITLPVSDASKVSCQRVTSDVTVEWAVVEGP